MRTKVFHHVSNPQQFKQKLLFWSQRYDEIVWLNSNNYASNYDDYDAVLAVDAFTSIKTDFINAFGDLKDYQASTNDWIFGYLTYDLKNSIENLKSNNFDGLGFSDLYFFQPKKLFLLKGEEVEIQYLKMVDDELKEDLINIDEIEFNGQTHSEEPVKIKLRIHKDEYFDKVGEMLGHIQRGDIYEANFCQEFYSENCRINPLETFNKLNNISKPPFATFLKIEDKYLMSATPERYIKKDGCKVISQPIKGTEKRSDNKKEDQQLALELSNDEKEGFKKLRCLFLCKYCGKQLMH